MKHYAIERWVDFSRDLVEQDERASMQGHLATGCEECRQLAVLTRRLVTCCANIAANQVPDATVRLARNIFPIRPTDRPQRGNRVPIELIFDSFLTPAPVGLRSTWQVGWQGLYHAGECSLDLRIEPELKSARAAVIGQLTNQAAPSVAMRDLSVSLQAGDEIVATTVSNQFGEFQMEYEQQSQLQLVIHLADSRVIQIPLKKLVFEKPALRSRGASNKR